MAEHLVDASQTEVYPDKSIKHIAHARKYKFLSLGLDQYCAISFRKYDRRPAPPNRDTVTVDVYKELEGKQPTKVVDGSKDIKWDTDYDAAFLISADLLDEPCWLEVQWNWWQGSTQRSARKWSMYYAAYSYMEDYASLTDSERQLCDSILNRFSMLRDNHYGNSMPNLAEDVQTDFTIDDIATEMSLAVQRINGSVTQPTNYVIGSEMGTHFPKEFYNLLMVSTMVNIIRKFVYGYLETPGINGNVNVAYADRTQYYNRWKDELRDLQADEKVLLDTYNRAHINFVGGAVLVGGGIFGGGSRFGGITSNAALAAISKGWRNSWFYPAATTPINM